MEPVNLNFIIIINVMMAVVTVIASVSMYNRKNLESKGFSEEYIKVLQKNQAIYAVIFPILLYAFQVVAWLIVRQYAEVITMQVYLKYIFVLSMVASLPFAALFGLRFNRKARQAAIETGAKIIIDFRFKALRLLYRLPLEIISTLLLVYFATFPFKGATVLYLYAALPWLYYAILRGSKNQNRALFRFNYLELGKWAIVINVFTVLLLTVELLAHLEKKIGTFDTVFGIVACVALLLKTIYYGKQFPAYKKEIQAKTAPPAADPTV